MTARSQPFQFRLDALSGVPVYRQIIDQVMAGIAAGRLAPGNQLPTVRQLAVDLAINPNTVTRAYREMEIRGVLETQQGSGTFISQREIQRDDVERQRRLDQITGEFVARAGSEGFEVQDLLDRLNALQKESAKSGKRR
ncbi:MAG TPA: GntR family transcriptional regulator [Bryobacteraceae bacterium]|jgi:GntR family transcriptional regulator|nr:GntR family transcriptional regulator [Bryobacteraceae bacterium]